MSFSVDAIPTFAAHPSGRLAHAELLPVEELLAAAWLFGRNG